jgi:hypothetical protein
MLLEEEFVVRNYDLWSHFGQQEKDYWEQGAVKDDLSDENPNESQLRQHE